MDKLKYFTVSEREKRRELRYENDRTKLENMTEHQLHFKYISVKSNLEYRKSLFTTILLGILLAILMNLGKMILSYIKGSLGLYFEGTNSYELTTYSIVITTFIVVVISVCILICIYLFLNKTRRLNKELLLIEDVRKKFL